MLSDKQRHGIHLRRSESPKVLTGLQSEKSEEELFHSRENHLFGHGDIAFPGSMFSRRMFPPDRD